MLMILFHSRVASWIIYFLSQNNKYISVIKEFLDIELKI
jgi:hypothetical protein